MERKTQTGYLVRADISGDTFEKGEQCAQAGNILLRLWP